MSVDEINEKIDELIKYAESEFKKIHDDLDRILHDVKKKENVLIINTYILKVRKDIRNLIRSLRMQLRAIRRSSRGLSRDVRELITERIEDVEDEVNDMISDLLDKLDEVKDCIRGSGEFSSTISPLSDIFKVTTTTLSSLSRILSDVFSEIRGEVEKGMSKGVSTVVSVRVSEEDLKVVDLLVSAGVFKSRSEALSFFIRRGIKGSEELLKKIKERIEDLSKLVNELGNEPVKS
ncbi:MAG: hypothetical protein RMH77_05390 [Sulfolobales archaeon]|nr:hypothetical protein [Sulfolobales archaeon]MDW7969818.1 hypothetical protein [Sulfolobales archaeon]